MGEIARRSTSPINFLSYFLFQSLLPTVYLCSVADAGYYIPINLRSENTLYFRVPPHELRPTDNTRFQWLFTPSLCKLRRIIVISMVFLY